jgi:hypothetical protein
MEHRQDQATEPQLFAVGHPAAGGKRERQQQQQQQQQQTKATHEVTIREPPPAVAPFACPLRPTFSRRIYCAA